MEQDIGPTTVNVRIETSLLDIRMHTAPLQASLERLMAWRFLEIRIKDTLDETLPSINFTTRAWSTYIHYMCLNRLMVQNEHVLSIFKKLNDKRRGWKDLGSNHVGNDELYMSDSKNVDLMIEAAGFCQRFYQFISFQRVVILFICWVLSKGALLCFKGTPSGRHDFLSMISWLVPQTQEGQWHRWFLENVLQGFTLMAQTFGSHHWQWKNDEDGEEC